MALFECFITNLFKLFDKNQETDRMTSPMHFQTMNFSQFMSYELSKSGFLANGN